MAIQVTWENEDERVLVLKYSGRWTWDDVFEVNTRIRRLLATIPYTVDCIIDFRDNAWFPPDLDRKTILVNTLLPADAGTTVFVGNQFAWELFSMMCERYAPSYADYTYAPTMKAAREGLRPYQAARR